MIGPLLVAKHFEIRHSLTLFAGVVGWRPGAGSIVKGITNGAVDFAARHLAANLAPVRVNAIAPGIVDSGAWDGKGEAKPAFLTGAAEQTLVGRSANRTTSSTQRSGSSARATSTARRSTSMAAFAVREAGWRGV